MTGILYGVGVGPGDPELVTVKAARLIAEADVVAYHSARHGRSNARACAAPYLRDAGPAAVLVDEVFVNAAAGVQAVYGLHIGHFRLHLARGWVGNVVLDPTRLTLCLLDDGIEQASAIDTGDVLHPRTHFGRIAAEG